MYKVVAPISAGGMGEVYRARDTKLGRQVAIKILPEAFAQNPDPVDTLWRCRNGVNSGHSICKRYRVWEIGPCRTIARQDICRLTREV